MITICSRCANCSRVNRNDPPWRWTCLAHKRMDGFGFVTEDTWDGFPPYLYCRDVNGGACPLYKELSSEHQHGLPE